MILNSLPDNQFINDIIAMYQDIPKTYNTVMLGNPFKLFLINFFNPVYGLSDNFKIPFNSSLSDGAVLIP